MFMKNLINGVLGKVSITTGFTLNSKYQVASQVTPDQPTRVAYVGIGRGGCERLELVRESDGVKFYHDAPPAIPSAANLDIFNPVPFRVIAVEAYNELTSTDEYDNNYRMRATLTIDNVDYYAWYLKKINLATTTTVLNAIDDNGIVSTYNQDANTLSAPVEVTDMPNSKLVAFAKASVSVTGSELRESIMVDGNNEDKLYFNELGVYTGLDYTNAPDGNGPFEAIGVELAIHRTFNNIYITDTNRLVDMDVILTNGASIVTMAEA